MLTERGYLRERITNGMFHTSYMRQIGHGGDCHLLTKGIDSRARDGGDPVEALIWDLREYAAPTLQQECDEFLKIIECGYRNYEVLKS